MEVESSYSIVAMFSGSPSPTPSHRFDTIAAVLCTIVVGLFLFLPGDSIKGLDGGLPWPFSIPADKVGHGILFWIETCFLHRALRWRTGAARALSLAASVALVYAGVSELAQLAIPLRSADGWDFLADACGIAVYVLSTSWIFRKDASKSAAEAAEWNYP